ncbi:ATP-dependent helicase HrpB [Pseudoroseicyclus aestuarii]|uniref:ATP-dependent helicase HrpB n=1 Tax=Pseudoroseicyclus aestuarii TaxID=1795041 RepID=A0A318T4Y3_9RHOB|nr:ATP-dependent helicase HrpB [Pseudoroseicyclus aestuarii]PYE85414.1 ATP-dependent helicase HrpB [Pseudoroseicyclus aestuarii]
MTALPPLPIDAALPDLLRAIDDRGMAVLQAPPGAGKTTRVPLALLDRLPGRILMLEPRRLAARAAAERMADSLGEAVGQTVGYRIRGEAKVSKSTRIEVVTEGILTRMLQSDPELPGTGAVIFDEFHERSLNADLGLALTLEVRGALRPDLVLVVMSATLDAGPVAELMDAPSVTSEGRAFPVERRWLETPLPPRSRLDKALADLIQRAAGEEEGGILAFLPGEGEIRRVQTLLERAMPGTDIRPLYGALPFAAQQKALAPSKARRIVLATSIAETSLTIPDIRVVVDMGRSRRARFDPGSGMSRLVTERVTKAEADQRAGRAGRVAPGVAYSLWTKGEHGALQAFPPPEIANADLSALALELALWGAQELPFLTPPPAPALAEAQALLGQLGALDGTGITAHGRRLAALPLHPRLGHMLLVAGRQAAPIAALLGERDPLRGAGSDLALRLRALAGGRDLPVAPDRGALDRARQEAKRLAKGLPEGPELSPGAMVALAYPDRIAQRRRGEAPRYLLSGGKGAVMEAADPLAQAPFLVAADTGGDKREAVIRLAAPITESEIRDLFAAQIEEVHLCDWSRREMRVTARRQERLGALVLSDAAWDAPSDRLAEAMLEGVRQIGLALSPKAGRFRARVALARGAGADVPDLSDEALMAGLEDWLPVWLGGIRSAADWRAADLTEALKAQLTHAQHQAVDRAVPSHYVTPMGRSVPIDYGGGQPEIAVRLQEMFGVTQHPRAAGQPLKIALLSPAGRPMQVTTDLPAFWTGSYGDVRRDMRGRYPKHPWPEDPAAAPPTLKTKRNKS